MITPEVHPSAARARPFRMRPLRAMGVGLGLRSSHYAEIFEQRPPVSWFEAISENFMGLTSKEFAGGRPLAQLLRVRETYPVVLHGVSMSIGSTDELNSIYLARLKELIGVVDPEWVSDHLCWTGVAGENAHDLLPLPYTREALRFLSERIDRVQNLLGRTMAFENVSAYLQFAHSEMTEWEFLSELTKSSGCRLLLDVNNVYVSSVNQGFDPLEFLRAIPVNSVAQVHLAGHSEGSNGLLIDTHDGPVIDEVWELYAEALKLWGAVPTLIEWDDKIPPLTRLLEEAKRAENVILKTLNKEISP